MRAHITASDGFHFYLLEGGQVVDQLDSNHIDMSWPTLQEFLVEMASSLITIEIRFIDELDEDPWPTELAIGEL
jgi:hypothetical protein